MPEPKCNYCNKGDKPDRRFGLWFHWDEQIKALISCAVKNNEQLEQDGIKIESER